jgi:hypothetical protein
MGGRVTVGDWIAVVPSLLTGGGVIWFAATKLERLTGAVEAVGDSLKAVVTKVNEHESRLTKGGL